MEFSDWQTQLSTVKERTQYAFKNSLFCDVEFAVVDSVNGGKVTIPANKYMLAVSSPVFEAMFYGNLKENNDTIDLQDCTKEGLQELLRFVHSDDVNLTGNNVMEVLYIANKYIMPFLVKKCRDYIQECLKPQEVFAVLPQLQQLSEEELEEHCWKVIDNKTQLAISSKPFLGISREMLYQLLTRDSLKIKELEIFQAVDRWAAKKTEEKGLESTGDSKRAILGEDIIRLIRFPLMSYQEFAEIVLPREILEKQELTELVQIFGNVSPLTNMFNRKRRDGVGLKCTKNRFVRVTQDSWTYPNATDAIRFSASKAVTLIGVQLFGRQGSTYHIALEILKGDKDQIISKLSSSYISESIHGKYYGFTVNLDNPVSLDPNVLYTVKATIKGPNSYFGDAGREVVTVDDDLKIIFKNSVRSTNGTSTAGGQFPSLILLC